MVCINLTSRIESIKHLWDQSFVDEIVTATLESIDQSSNYNARQSVSIFFNAPKIAHVMMKTLRCK